MGNKKLQIFGFWRLASWCKSFILSQLFLGLIVKNKLLNYVDITHTSISFMENAFPQWLIIISYFHLLSYKLDEIILLKKQWEVDEMSETMRGPPAPPTSTPLPLWPLSGDSHLLQHVVVLSCPHAHPSFPVLKLPSSSIPLLCIPLQEVTFFFRSWEVTFPLLVSEWVFFSINSDNFISWAASWATMTLLSLAYSFDKILLLGSYCYDLVVSTV